MAQTIRSFALTYITRIKPVGDTLLLEREKKHIKHSTCWSKVKLWLKSNTYLTCIKETQFLSTQLNRNSLGHNLEEKKSSQINRPNPYIIQASEGADGGKKLD